MSANISINTFSILSLGIKAKEGQASHADVSFLAWILDVPIDCVPFEWDPNRRLVKLLHQQQYVKLPQQYELAVTALCFMLPLTYSPSLEGLEAGLYVASVAIGMNVNKFLKALCNLQELGGGREAAFEVLKAMLLAETYQLPVVEEDFSLMQEEELNMVVEFIEPEGEMLIA